MSTWLKWGEFALSLVGCGAALTALIALGKLPIETATIVNLLPWWGWTMLGPFLLILGIGVSLGFLFFIGLLPLYCIVQLFENGQDYYD